MKRRKEPTPEIVISSKDVPHIGKMFSNSHSSKNSPTILSYSRQMRFSLLTTLHLAHLAQRVRSRSPTMVSHKISTLLDVTHCVDCSTLHLSETCPEFLIESFRSRSIREQVRSHRVVLQSYLCFTRIVCVGFVLIR